MTVEWERQGSGRHLLLVGIDNYGDMFYEVFFHYGWNCVVVERCIREASLPDKRDIIVGTRYGTKLIQNTSRNYRFLSLNKVKSVKELLGEFPSLEVYREELSEWCFKSVVEAL